MKTTTPRFLIALTVLPFMVLSGKLEIASVYQFEALSSLTSQETLPLVMDVDDQYLLEKEDFPEQQAYTLTLKYYTKSLQILTRDISEKNMKTISYTDTKTPFICFQILVSQNMPFRAEFDQIWANIQNNQVRGMAKIMTVLNAATWTKEMLNFFYQNSVSHKFFMYPEKSHKEIMKHYQMLLGKGKFFLSNALKPIASIKFPAEPEEKARLITQEIRADVQFMLGYIMDHIKGERHYNVDHRSTPLSNYKMTDQERKNIDQFITVQDFVKNVREVVNEEMYKISEILLNDAESNFGD